MLPLFSLVHLRRQFDQGVKVSCPLGTCDVLNVVRQSGRVRCLPVNLLHLEKNVSKLFAVTCSSQSFGRGPVSRVHNGSRLRLRESQDL